MTKLATITQSITKSPVLWGSLGAAGFYGLIHGGPLATPFILRYFTGHPVEYAETLMFAIGLAALLLKLFDTLGQHAGLGQPLLPTATQTTQSIEVQCQDLLGRLSQVDAPQEGYYVSRLRAAIQYVWRRGAADGLDDQLKYLADLDATRSHAAFGLFRIIVWAIPIMGFLGTVVGITMALNGIDKNHLDESMQHVLTGLGVKFDTTALALAMSMVLMFIHYFVDRAESGLLEKVDRAVEDDLTGRFQQLSGGGDGQSLAVRRMAETMVQATERVVQRQAELWRESMEAATARWAHLTDGAADVLKKSLVESLSESLKAPCPAPRGHGASSGRADPPPLDPIPADPIAKHPSPSGPARRHDAAGRGPRPRRRCLRRSQPPGNRLEPQSGDSGRSEKLRADRARLGGRYPLAQCAVLGDAGRKVLDPART